MNIGDRLDVLRELSDRDRHLMLCDLIGYDVDLFDKILARVQSGEES